MRNRIKGLPLWCKLEVGGGGQSVLGEYKRKPDKSLLSYRGSQVRGGDDINESKDSRSKICHTKSSSGHGRSWASCESGVDGTVLRTFEGTVPSINQLQQACSNGNVG